jgi:hypothetical protein
VFALVVFGMLLAAAEHREYRETIARELRRHHTVSRLAGSGRWAGQLQLTLGELALYDSVSSPLKLKRVDALQWSLIHWEPRFDSIEIERPDLNAGAQARWARSRAELNDSASGEGLSTGCPPEEIVIRRRPVAGRNARRDELAMQHSIFVSRTPSFTVSLRAVRREAQRRR